MHMSQGGAARTDVERLAGFHELLSTMTRALDVREILPQLSKTIGAIIPHDGIDLAVLENGVFRHFASTSGADAELIQADDTSRARVLEDGFDSERGFRAGLRVPVMADSKLIGVMAFFSRQRNAYSDRDLALAQQVADYV